jgi:hypothetical protein
MTDLHETFPTDSALRTDVQVTPVPAGNVAPAAAAPVLSPARVLLAVLVLAAAAFVWFNFFSLAPAPQPPALPAPRPAAQPLPAAAASSSGELPQVAASVAPAALAPGVARDLVISELPFLVTAAPALSAAAESAAPAAAAASRPTLQRISVNPFTPVVLNEAVAAAPELPARSAELASQGEAGAVEAVIEVPIPAAPPQAAVPRTISVDAAPVAPPAAVTGPAAVPAATAALPAPAVQAPASAPLASVRNLPRALPSGSLSPAPRLLQERRAVEDIPTPNLAQLATVQEPAPVLPEGVTSTPLRADAQEPAPLPAVPTALTSHGVPAAAGITPLSRYVRDNNVTFTGSVLGPVSVGVFHTSLTDAAIVISLGQALPDTSIVLTDLRGQQAELTLDEASQILTMEVRR